MPPERAARHPGPRPLGIPRRVGADGSVRSGPGWPRLRPGRRAARPPAPGGRARGRRYRSGDVGDTRPGER